MTHSILLLALPALCFAVAESMFFGRPGFHPMPLAGIAPLAVPLKMGFRRPVMKRGPVVRRAGPVMAQGGQGGSVSNVVSTGGARNFNRNGDLIVVVNDNNHFGGGLRGGLGGLPGGFGAIGGGLSPGVMVGGLDTGMGGLGIGAGNLGLGANVMGLGAGFRGDVDLGDFDRRAGIGNMGRLGRELSGSYNINDADTVVIGGRV